MAQDQCGQGESQDLSGFREGGERGALPRPFAPLHTEEQKNLLNNHSFLKDNCRAQANDSQSGGLSFLAVRCVTWARSANVATGRWP